MSFARKQAFISCLVWLVITVLFAVVFFSTGAESFGNQDNRMSRMLVAVIIVPGFVLNLVMLERTRRGKKRGDLDERDDTISTSASEVTMIVLGMLFYIASIALFAVYQEAGMVPVGWLYLMAYGSFCVVSLVHSTVTLFLDFGGKADG